MDMLVQSHVFVHAHLHVQTLEEKPGMNLKEEDYWKTVP